MKKVGSVKYKQSFKKDVRPEPIVYKIKHINNGEYAIIQKYVPTGDLTTHSRYDNLSDAVDALADLQRNLTNAEALEYSRQMSNY